MSQKLGDKKKRELLNKAAEESGANDAWAMVELYRWQHGELPPQDQSQCKELVISEALRKMADAMVGPPDKWPNPFAIQSAFKYAAKQLEGQEQLQADLKLIREYTQTEWKRGALSGGMGDRLIEALGRGES